MKAYGREVREEIVVNLLECAMHLAEIDDCCNHWSIHIRMYSCGSLSMLGGIR